MDRPSLLVLVRHGESLINKTKKENVYLADDGSAELFKGLPDHKIPLTSQGLNQAEITGHALLKKFGLFDVVYDSGYVRTRQTKEGILQACSPEERQMIKARESHLLRERERGYTFNMTTKEVDRYFPWLKEYFETFGYFYSRPPGGQSQAEVCDQVYQFIGTLFSHRAGKKVLIVAHGGSIRAVRFNLEKWTVSDYEQDSLKGSCKNCGVTVYRYSEKTSRLELEEYNKIYW